MTPCIAEFLGTMIMILLGEGVVANVLLDRTKGHGAGWMAVTTAWALAVFTGVVVAGPYSGAHLNPAVTVGLALSGGFPWSGVAGYVTAQFAGAAAGAVAVWVVYRNHFNATDDAQAIRDVFCTTPAIRRPLSNTVSEAAGTFVLLFGVLYITGATAGTDAATPVGLGSLGAIPVSLIVWVIGLALGGTTGYAINPARDLAPRLVHSLLPIPSKGGSDWGYAWVPVTGPLLGSAAAAGLYLLLT